MTAIREALKNVVPLPEVRAGEDGYDGKHIACRLCNPTAVEGTPLVGLCGEEFESVGTSTSTHAAWCNRACSACVNQTSEHLRTTHPDLVPPVPEF